MISSPSFLRARALGFSLIILTSLVWIVLLCVYMFFEWDTSDTAERPIIAVMLLTNTLTLIMLLILLILPFREWLDAARFLFLVLAHFGVAGTFAFWKPKFHCPTSTPDSEGVCHLLNLYILVASWIIPVLLIIYVSGLSFAMMRSSRPGTSPVLERESILPMMRPVLDGNSRILSYSTEKPLDRASTLEEQRKHISGLSSRTNSMPSSLTKLPPAFFV
ncbi:hypothetical protein B0H19DRAFT_1165650 [Mycena capillaripes]|nr:hypothetical protein B0H19DRAFT_1165650 [Mycena capillaripes]